jgi:hypothetical protein
MHRLRCVERGLGLGLGRSVARRRSSDDDDDARERGAPRPRRGAVRALTRHASRDVRTRGRGVRAGVHADVVRGIREAQSDTPSTTMARQSFARSRRGCARRTPRFERRSNATWSKISVFEEFVIEVGRARCGFRFVVRFDN